MQDSGVWGGMTNLAGYTGVSMVKMGSSRMGRVKHVKGIMEGVQSAILDIFVMMLGVWHNQTRSTQYAFDGHGQALRGSHKAP